MSESVDLMVRIAATNATQTAMAQVGKDLDGLKRRILEIGAAIVSGLALKNIIDSTRQWSEQVTMLSRNLGISSQAASQLNFISQSVGISAEDTARAFDILAKNMDLVSQKWVVVGAQSGAAQPALQRLGIATRDTHGEMRPFADVLGDIHDKLGVLKDGAQKTALEMELFGRSGADINRLISLSREEFKALAVQAGELGLVLNNKSIEQFSDKARIMDLALTGLKVTLGQALLPILTDAVLWVTRMVTKVTEGIRTSREFQGVIKGLGDAFRHVLGTVKEVVDRIGQFIADVKSLGLGGAIEKLFSDALAKAKAILPQIGAELDKMGPVGFVLKLLGLSAAVSLAAGVGGLLFGGLLDALKLGVGAVGWSLGSGGVMGAAIMLALSLLVAEATMTSGGSALIPHADLVGVAAAVFSGIEGVSVTRGLGAKMPIALSVGAGITIGVLASEVIAKSMTNKNSPLNDPMFWTAALGLGAGLTGLAIGLGLGPAGALLIGLTAVLTVTLGTAVVNQPPGGTGDFFTPDRPGFTPPNTPGMTHPVPGYAGGGRVYPGTAIEVGSMNPNGDGSVWTGEYWAGGYRGPADKDLRFGTLGVSASPVIRSPAFFESQAYLARALYYASLPNAGEAYGLKMAAGGIVARPTRAIIGDDGPEAVIPLRRGGFGTNISMVFNITGANAQDIAREVGDILLRQVGNIRGLAY